MIEESWKEQQKCIPVQFHIHNSFHYDIYNKIEIDFGKLKKVGNGNSLFEISSNGVLIYFRYSKLTKKSKLSSGFYGLRQEDIKILSGKKSFICFVWDNYDEPILIPFRDYWLHSVWASPALPIRAGCLPRRVLFPDSEADERRDSGACRQFSGQ